jgi:Tol biopolymer transport system component
MDVPRVSGNEERREMCDSRRSFFLTVAMVAIASILSTLPSLTSAQPHYSDWSLPVNLGPVINTAAPEAGPHLSKDRRSLYFYSVRTGPGGSDIWVAERENVDEEFWGTPYPVAPLNTTGVETSMSLSRDGHWLFFTRGGLGNRDIWVSYREHVHDNLAWQPPVPVGAGINTTASDEMDPSFFENEDGGAPQLFFARGNDIYVSSLLPDGTWGPAIPVSSLNGVDSDRGISVRFDGLEAFFFSNRGSTSADLWSATRNSVLDPWSELTKLILLSSPVADGEPDISPDRETLYFNSNRTGLATFGAQDLYVSYRTKGKP